MMKNKKLKKTLLIFFSLGIGLFAFNYWRGEDITPLMRAAKSGDNELIHQLIEEKVAINAKSHYHWTALMFAVGANHEESVKQLLQVGADPNIISKSIPASFETTGDYPPTTALRETLRQKNVRIAHLLLDNGAKIDPVAFALTGRTGNIALIKRFIALGADVNQLANESYEDSPLIEAIRLKHFITVKWLLNNGANPNIFRFRPALTVAVKNNDIEMVRLLLSHGAQPNQTFDGDIAATALFEAASYFPNKDDEKNLVIVQILLEHGADPMHKIFSNEETILDFVKQQKERTQKKISQEMDTGQQEDLKTSLAYEEKIIQLFENNIGRIK